MDIKHNFLTVVMATALGLTAPVVYADMGNRGNMMGGGRPSDSHSEHGWKHMHGDHMWGGLNLTDDQKKQLKDLWQKQKEASKAFFEQSKANREADLKKILTPEQYTKFMEMKKHKLGRHGRGDKEGCSFCKHKRGHRGHWDDDEDNE